ncbi:MAG: ASCH domain-containing protein [Actinomycetota bacterium]|nr:ASCH domain-containing protein [Actinomycetota bacterium]
MSEALKAITVRQPWAWAIVMGYKDVENRSRRTERRGSLLIHAGLQMDPDGFQFLWELGLHRKLPDELARGALIGEVQLSDCRYGYESDWSIPGRWQWIFTNPREFRSPLGCPGAQGFFSPDVSPFALGQTRSHAINHRRR